MSQRMVLWNHETSTNLSKNLLLPQQISAHTIAKVIFKIASRLKQRGFHMFSPGNLATRIVETRVPWRIQSSGCMLPEPRRPGKACCSRKKNRSIFFGNNKWTLTNPRFHIEAERRVFELVNLSDMLGWYWDMLIAWKTWCFQVLHRPMGQVQMQATRRPHPVPQPAPQQAPQMPKPVQQPPQLVPQPTPQMAPASGGHQFTQRRFYIFIFERFVVKEESLIYQSSKSTFLKCNVQCWMSWMLSFFFKECLKTPPGLGMLQWLVQCLQLALQLLLRTACLWCHRCSHLEPFSCFFLLIFKRKLLERYLRYMAKGPQKEEFQQNMLSRPPPLKQFLHFLQLPSCNFGAL